MRARCVILQQRGFCAIRVVVVVFGGWESGVELCMYIVSKFRLRCYVRALELSFVYIVVRIEHEECFDLILSNCRSIIKG